MFLTTFQIDSITPIKPLLQAKDIDGAFHTWCELAQAWLSKIPHTKNGVVSYDSLSKRGQVRFQKQCLYPKQVDAHSLNLNCRRIAQALGRAEEFTRARNWGIQAAHTWKNIAKVRPSIPREHAANFQSLFTTSFNIDTITQLISLLKTILVELRSQDRKNRVKAWKRKPIQSEKKSYQWLKSQPQDTDISMKLPNGKFTANTDEQLNEIMKAWLPIFQKFVNRLPDMKHFDKNFAPFMKNHPMTLTPMTGSFLIQTLKNVKPSSSSLDGWRPESLVALSRWYPDLFNGLALILDWIELNARWPSPLTKAYTALIPKDGMGDAPSPADFRPISVLSAVYRLWAKARFQDSLTQLAGILGSQGNVGLP